MHIPGPPRPPTYAWSVRAYAEFIALLLPITWAVQTFEYSISSCIEIHVRPLLVFSTMVKPELNWCKIVPKLK